MLHATVKSLRCSVCAISVAIAALAQSTIADVVVQGDPILRPSIVWPNDFGQWGTNYGGNPDGWADQSETTPFEQEYGLTHSYDSNTQSLFIDNASDEDKTKHVWVRLLFDPRESYPAPIGEKVDPAQWATIEASQPDGVDQRITLTGAAWLVNPITGQLIVEQSWTIHPQPYSETINLSNIIGNAGGPDAFKGLMAETVCIPGPAAYALLALSGLVVARRRRP